MSLYCGIDLHSNNCYLAVLDEQLQPVLGRRTPNSLETILAALEPHQEQIAAIAVESTFNWYWLVDGLMEAGYHVELVNTSNEPLRLADYALHLRTIRPDEPAPSSAGNAVTRTASPPKASTSNPRRSRSAACAASACRPLGGNSINSGTSNRWLSRRPLVSRSVICSNNTRSCATC